MFHENEINTDQLWLVMNKVKPRIKPLFYILEIICITERYMYYSKNTSIPQYYQMSIENLMGVKSSHKVLKNVSDSTIQKAGDLFVYLNFCPENTKYEMMRLEIEQFLSEGRIL